MKGGWGLGIGGSLDDGIFVFNGDNVGVVHIILMMYYLFITMI